MTEKVSDVRTVCPTCDWRGGKHYHDWYWCTQCGTVKTSKATFRPTRMKDADQILKAFRDFKHLGEQLLDWGKCWA